MRGNNKLVVQSELDEFEEEKRSSIGTVTVSWPDLWNKVYLRRPLIIAIVINMSQQLSGSLVLNKFIYKIFKYQYNYFILYI